MSEPTPKPEQTPAERFHDAMKRIVSVPKEEIQRREEQYRKQRAGEQKPQEA